MTTEEFYIPGDLIHSEAPFVYALDRKFQGKNCDHCLMNSGNLKRCGTCMYVWYCGKQCQKEDWLDHKFECKYLCRLPNQKGQFEEKNPFGATNDWLRLLGKLVFKLKGKDWYMHKVNIGNTTMSFGDLMSHNEERKKEPKAILFNLQLMHQLKLYIGEENLPEEEELFLMIGKVTHNAFRVAHDHGIKASALYLGASLVDHSCIPSAVHVFRKGSIEMRAITKIPKNDLSKVTISYIVMLCIADTTQKMVKSFYGPCYCIDCSLPYGESILSDIVDKKAAYTVIDVTEKFLNHKENEFSQMNKSLKIEPVIRDTPEMLCLKSQLDFLQQMQEGVLGETHLLRIRVLYIRCLIWNNISDILKLIHSLERAFGANSREVVEPYSLLQKAYCRAGNVAEMNQCQTKIDRLSKMHYGTNLQSSTKG